MNRLLFSKGTFFFIATGLVLLAYQNCGNAEFAVSPTRATAFSSADSDGDGLDDNTEIGLGIDPEKYDTDGDGLSDGAEVNTYGTNPNNPDTDGGGVPDGVEVNAGTDPVSSPGDDQGGEAIDTDGDGLADEVELSQTGTDPLLYDSDGDGLSDGYEVNTSGTDPNDIDTDDGGVMDGVEVANGTNPKAGYSSDDNQFIDTDSDGLSDAQEALLGSNPEIADTDEDGLTDGGEIFVFQTNPLNADTDGGSVNDGLEVARGSHPIASPGDDIVVALDRDSDGLTDESEEALGTNPDDPDSDDDGLLDGVEVNFTNSDPNNPDTDNGGVQDGAEVSQGKSPTEPSDDVTGVDTDEDGLTDSQEGFIGTDPTISDSDNDLLKDGAEVFTHRTNPNNPDTDGGLIWDGVEVNDGKNPKDPSDDIDNPQGDEDNDGLTNQQEAQLGTNPSVADSDGDHLFDGAEVNTHGTNPKEQDTDGGGIIDGFEVILGKDPKNGSDDAGVIGNTCRLVDRFGLWKDPDNSRAIDPAHWVGEIEPYKGEITAVENYGYRTASAHLTHGPALEFGKFKVFLYDGSDGLSLFMVTNQEEGSDREVRKLGFELTTKNNNLMDYLKLSDEPSQMKQTSSGAATKSFEANFTYFTSKTDGAVVGPFVGSEYWAHFSMTDVSGIEASEFSNANGTVYNLDKGHFIIGHYRTVECEMVVTSNKVSLQLFPVFFDSNLSGVVKFTLDRELQNGETLKCYINAVESTICAADTLIPYSLNAGGSQSFRVVLLDRDGRVTDETVYNWFIVSSVLGGTSPYPHPPQESVSCTGNVKTKKVKMSFPASTTQCHWGLLNNLEPRNGYLQARRLQSLPLSLPFGSQICSMNFTIPEQNYRFDDGFTLSLDHAVLASNMKFALSENSKGQLAMDWLHARGMKLPETFASGAENYCLGESTGQGTCTLPRTDQAGPLSLQFSSDLIKKVGAKEGCCNEHRIVLETFGDNDASDCQHSGLEFDVEVQYVEP